MPAMFTWVLVDGRFKLAQMPKPLGGDPGLDRSMRALKSAGVDVLVSMLTDDEMQRFRLDDERERANFRGLEFFRYPIEDHQVPPSTDDAIAFAQTILAKLEDGKNVVFHCYAGIGRSGLMAATVLFLAGLDMADACERLTKARKHNVPETAGQRAWLESLVRPS